eukprot:gene5828-7252_t
MEIQNKINLLTQNILQSLITHSDKEARKRTRKEIIDQYYNKSKINNIINVPVIAKIKIIRTTFNDPKSFHILLNANGSLTQPQKSDSRQQSFLCYWNEDLPFSLCFSNLDYLVEPDIIGNGMKSRTVIVEKELWDFDGLNVIGNIQFSLELSPIPSKGLKYWKRLPVFDPDCKIPNFVMPSPSFVHHDEFNELIVAFVIFYWYLRGEKHCWDMLPPNVQTRSDFSNSDEFFVYRRLNGCNRPYNHFVKVDGKEWDYELRLNLSGYEKKKDIWLPDNTCCKFALRNDQLEILSISYQMEPNGELITQLADNSDEWNQLKIKYMMIEFNYNITWAHVGVHFIVEMYAMAFYRNIVDNPIGKLLNPHFDGVIFNNWLVVRPMPNGVVTMAAALTYEGQVQMLEDKFREVTYRWKPNPLPSNIKNNTYDPANESMWSLITEYVDEFINENRESILANWDEIEGVSNDLVEHSLHPDPNANKISNIDELRDCCIFIIYQAIFRHAWIHWKAWDDEAIALFYKKDDPTVETSLKDQAYYQNLGNMIEAGVQYPSPYVRQYPILDIEFGAPESLQKKLWQHAHKINPGISIGSLVMSPNI